MRLFVDRLRGVELKLTDVPGVWQASGWMLNTDEWILMYCDGSKWDDLDEDEISFLRSRMRRRVEKAYTNPEPPEKKARKVERLPPSTHFTPQQALDYVQQTIIAGNLTDVMIIGWQPDGDYYSISSHMSREWALWMLHEGIDYVRCVNRWAPPSAEASR